MLQDFRVQCLSLSISFFWFRVWDETHVPGQLKPHPRPPSHQRPKLETETGPVALYAAK